MNPSDVEHLKTEFQRRNLPPVKPREWSKTMVFVPRESIDHLAGTSQFATKDGDLYERGRNGVIRSMHSKPMRKKDRVRLRRAQ